MHRVKNGIASVHPIRGDEIRALRKLRHDYLCSTTSNTRPSSTRSDTPKGARPVQGLLERLTLSLGAAFVSLGFLSFLGVFNPNAWKCQNDSYVYMAETFQGKQINQSMSVAERREAALEITPRAEKE